MRSMPSSNVQRVVLLRVGFYCAADRELHHDFEVAEVAGVGGETQARLLSFPLRARKSIEKFQRTMN
jgi:hypothetical protein